MKAVKVLTVATFTAASLAGCAPMEFNYSPMADQGGRRVYALKTTYGGPDGDIKAARELLGRKAKQICEGPYDRIRETQNARRTAWGSKNGQTNLLSEVRCR